MKHMTNPSTLCLTAVFLAKAAISHEHHTHSIAQGQYVSAAPIDFVLWLHIFIQTVTWMFVFPAGTLLGVIKSRWHAPVQTAGLICAIIGYFLGHRHGGREFKSNVHGQFASFVAIWLAAQVLCGVYLKLHLQHSYWVQMRRAVLAAHAVLGIGMPLISWCQVLLGGITALGFCHGSHAGQCIIHAGFGSALVGVGVFLLFTQQCKRYSSITPLANSDTTWATLVSVSGMLVVLADWISKEPNQRASLDLLSMGLVCLGVHAFVTWLAWISDCKMPRRAQPGILLVISGWYLAANSTLSAPSVLHRALGFSMQAAGVTYILAVGVSETLTDSSTAIIKAICLFRLLTAYSLGASGLLFIGANKEQLQCLSNGSMPSLLLLILLHSAALLLFSYVSFILYIWSSHSTNGTTNVEEVPKELLAGHGRLPHIRSFSLVDDELA